MRAVGQAEQVSVKAYAGTTGVILAFDVTRQRRTGLLGFAIQRSGGNRPTKWLGGALSFPGVERCFAIQAGREIRVMVQPSEVDDRIAAKLAFDISKQIESDLEYPGQIKVTVIRESRVTEVAR